MAPTLDVLVLFIIKLHETLDLMIKKFSIGTPNLLVVKVHQVTVCIYSEISGSLNLLKRSKILKNLP